MTWSHRRWESLQQCCEAAGRGQGKRSAQTIQGQKQKCASRNTAADMHRARGAEHRGLCWWPRSSGAVTGLGNIFPTDCCCSQLVLRAGNIPQQGGVGILGRLNVCLCSSLFPVFNKNWDKPGLAEGKRRGLVLCPRKLTLLMQSTPFL